MQCLQRRTRQQETTSVGRRSKSPDASVNWNVWVRQVPIGDTLEADGQSHACLCHIMTNGLASLICPASSPSDAQLRSMLIIFSFCGALKVGTRRWKQGCRRHITRSCSEALQDAVPERVAIEHCWPRCVEKTKPPWGLGTWRNKRCPIGPVHGQAGSMADRFRHFSGLVVSSSRYPGECWWVVGQW